MSSTAKGMKGLALGLFAIVLAVALSVAATAWAKKGTGPDPTPVTACGTLSGTSVIYRVMNNISGSTGNCIVLSGNHSALDLHGFTITGPGTDFIRLRHPGFGPQ